MLVEPFQTILRWRRWAAFPCHAIVSALPLLFLPPPAFHARETPYHAMPPAALPRLFLHHAAEQVTVRLTCCFVEHHACHHACCCTASPTVSAHAHPRAVTGDRRKAGGQGWAGDRNIFSGGWEGRRSTTTTHIDICLCLYHSLLPSCPGILLSYHHHHTGYLCLLHTIVSTTPPYT